MDNLDESEKNAKVSDSAYSNSCSTSQSRRSHSSKSTRSTSNSSGSSGYGGKESTSDSSKLSQMPEKRTKDKEGKNQQAQTELFQIKTDVEFRLPHPAPITEPGEELQIETKHLRGGKVGGGDTAASPPPATSDQTENAVQGSFEVVKEDTVEYPDIIPQASTNALTTKCGSAEGFSCLISMQDGVVLYMSSSLTDVLGFPKDMWVGRSFIDFVHPFDHKTFASQITSGLAVPKETGVVHTVQSPVTSVATIFCRIRRYRSLATGFNVKARTVCFIPFMLKLSVKNVDEENGSTIYLVVQAKPVTSAYKTPNEAIVDPIPFVMRHVANGNLEYMDNVAVPLLGYMPQEITSSNMLQLYDPQDLPYVRHLYKTTMKQGRASRSEPYRLMAQNGDYLKLETEWSSLINPWSRKLEFVIGKHYIIEGPANPDVFQPPPTPKATKVPEEDASEIDDLRYSIVRILNEVPTRPAELVKQEMAKQCSHLASIIESLIKEQPMVEQELRLEIQENDNSYYERDSVILRGISPHHDYSDGKSSTGTTTSYDHLNYNNKLKRFFDSHQVAFCGDGANVTDITSVPIKGHVCTGECPRPSAHYSGDSMGVSSPESPRLASEKEGPVDLPHDYHSIWLSESILTKHNSEMQKIFVKNNREVRPAKREERVKLSIECKQKKRDHLLRCNATFVPTAILNSAKTELKAHGLKRQSKQAEVEQSAHKHHCATSHQLRRRPPPGPAAPEPPVSTAPAWPCNYGNGPFMPQQMSVISPVPGFVPIYFTPTAGPAVAYTPGMSAHGFTKTTAPVQYQTPAVQYMMYGQVYGPPVVVSPVNHKATFPKPPGAIQNHNATSPKSPGEIQKQFTCAQNNLSLATRNYEEACKPGMLLKPPTKAQLAAWREEKRAAEVTSKLAWTRPWADRSASRSVTCSPTNALNRSSEEIPDSGDSTDGESSYSSFYSSFFRTDSGSAEDSSDAVKQAKSVNFAAPTFPAKGNLRNIQLQKRKKEPPWMEQVCVTPELIYKYQVATKNLDEVLIEDRKKLMAVEQPALVNEQLGQLYMELELEGAAARLALDEGITSSGSSSDDGQNLAVEAVAKRAKRTRKYSKLVMIFEEDAPLPCPDDDAEPESSISAA